MLILLDLDGVMIPASNWKSPEILEDGFPDFNVKSVCGLNKIIAETNAEILLTTSHKTLHSIESWNNIFLKRGICVKIAVLSETGNTYSRKDEIINWFQANPSEQNFVIIDDDKSLNDLPKQLKSKLVLTSPLVGLNAELAIKAIQILLTINPS